MMTIFQEYHNQLLYRADLIGWFLERGLGLGSINRHQIGFDGAAITIPIFDADGKFLFFKYRRSPLVQGDGPKYWYEKGNNVSLYNVEQLAANPDIVICEGEFDCLVLEENGFPAVTSTGGAMSFKEEWVPLFAGKKVWICLDNDTVGEKGALRIAKMLPGAKIIALPRQVGEHGDVTDFFMKLKSTREDFIALCRHAYLPKFQEEPPPKPKRNRPASNDDVARAKTVPIWELLNVQTNRAGTVRCPFHNEKSPSFRVFPDNHAHCFGCDWHGDSIDFVMKSHNLTFIEAVKFLCNSV